MRCKLEACDPKFSVLSITPRISNYRVQIITECLLLFLMAYRHSFNISEVGLHLTSNSSHSLPVMGTVFALLVVPNVACI